MSRTASGELSGRFRRRGALVLPAAADFATAPDRFGGDFTLLLGVGGALLLRPVVTSGGGEGDRDDDCDVGWEMDGTSGAP